jgi:hypothetical protein
MSSVLPNNPARRRFLGGLAALPLLSLAPVCALAHTASARRFPGDEVSALPLAAEPNPLSTPSSIWDTALNLARQNDNLTAYELALRNGPHDAFFKICFFEFFVEKPHAHDVARTILQAAI